MVSRFIFFLLSVALLFPLAAAPVAHLVQLENRKVEVVNAEYISDDEEYNRDKSTSNSALPLINTAPMSAERYLSLVKEELPAQPISNTKTYQEGVLAVPSYIRTSDDDYDDDDYDNDNYDSIDQLSSLTTAPFLSNTDLGQQEEWLAQLMSNTNLSEQAVLLNRFNSNREPNTVPYNSSTSDDDYTEQVSTTTPDQPLLSNNEPLQIEDMPDSDDENNPRCCNIMGCLGSYLESHLRDQN